MSDNPVGDVLAEIGKIVLFLIGKYYEVMAWFHGWTAPTVGVPAAFLITALCFVVFPAILVYVLASLAVSSTYSVLEFSWSLLVRIIVLIVVTFLVLFLLR